MTPLASAGTVMQDDNFNQLMSGLRPKLHRYCARMTGSSIDGDDVVQDTFVKAIGARAAGAAIDHPERWLFRIAHNAALDFLRRRGRMETAQPEDVLDMAAASDADAGDAGIAAASFGAFMRLPALQRCAVILKDVLGHSVEEIAAIAGCTMPAAKSALQRGRARIRDLARERYDVRLPLLSDADRHRLLEYVEMFRAGNFDAVRLMLADDVRLDLVARLRLQGRDNVGRYFTGYADAPHWRFAAGAVDGRPVMLVFDSRGPMDTPAHFVVLDWRADRIAGIRDFLFAPYVLEAAEWLRLS